MNNAILTHRFTLVKKCRDYSTYIDIYKSMVLYFVSGRTNGSPKARNGSNGTDPSTNESMDKERTKTEIIY